MCTNKSALPNCNDKKKKIKVDKNWKHTETSFWKCSILQLNVLKKLKHNHTLPFCSQSDVEQDKDEARWSKRQQFKAFRTAARRRCSRVLYNCWISRTVQTQQLLPEGKPNLYLKLYTQKKTFKICSHFCAPHQSTGPGCSLENKS